MLLFLWYDSKAQIYIGDTLPNIDIGHVLYTKDSRFTTEILKDKYIILEFGTTYCSPCIESFKKMNLLKTKNGNRLDFYMVTPQKIQDVQSFLRYQKLDSLVNVPIITQDTALKKLFRHVAIPHLVWINSSGIIVAVTNHEYLNQENIDLFLTQQELNWPIKWDFPYNSKHNMLIFNPENFHEINKPSRFYSSVISNHMEGVLKAADVREDSLKNEVIITGRNLTLLNIYLRHFSRNFNSNLFASQVLLDRVDSEMFFYEKIFGTPTEWDNNNTYSYEFVFPLDFSKQKINNIILQQFDLFLNQNVSLEIMSRPCWVLYYNPKKVILNVKDHPKVRNVEGLLRAINRIPHHKPIVLNGSFDKNLLNEIYFLLDDNDYEDLPLINKSLAPYGLSIREQDCDIETLIIRKN